MPRTNDVSAIFNRFISDFRTVLKKEVTRAVAEVSKTALSPIRSLRAARHSPTKAGASRSTARPANPALAGKPGYSKYGRKLGRPGRKE